MEFSYGNPSIKKALENLNLVCKLRPGFTIDTNVCRIVDHSRWYSTYVRSVCNENRYKTILWLEDLFEKISNLVIHLDYLIEKSKLTSPPPSEDFELLEYLESPDQSDYDEEESVVVLRAEIPPNILNTKIDPAERKDELVELLIQANKGLSSLLETYKDDNIITDRVKQIIKILHVAQGIKVSVEPLQTLYATNNFIIRLHTLRVPFRRTIYPIHFQSITSPTTSVCQSDID